MQKNGTSTSRRPSSQVSAVKPVNHDERRSGQSRFQRGRAAGNDGGLRAGQRLPGIRDQFQRKAPRAAHRAAVGIEHRSISSSSQVRLMVDATGMLKRNSGCRCMQRRGGLKHRRQVQLDLFAAAAGQQGNLPANPAPAPLTTAACGRRIGQRMPHELHLDPMPA